MNRLAPTLISLMLLAAGCGGASATPPTTTEPDEMAGQLGALAAAEAMWAESAPADYTLEVVDGAADGPQMVAVRDGDVVSLGADVAAIEETFAEIEDSLRSGAEVDVDYHPDFGYPTRVVIDADADGSPDTEIAYGDLAAMPIVRSLAELRTAQRLWEAQDLDSYRYLFRYECTCPQRGTFEVDIVDGRVAETRALDEAARTGDLDPRFDIDSAFDDLAEWFTDSGPLIEDGIVDVDVRMDPQLGYPRWFRIEAAGMDDDYFPERFTMVVTIDLVGELEPVEPAIDLAALQQAEEAAAVWQATAVADYRFVLALHCECAEEVAGPFAIGVRQGTVASAVLLRTETVAVPLFVTIDEALEAIGLAIADGTPVDVAYNAEYGYPEFALIDPEAVAVDGGLAFSITEFEEL